MMLLADVFPKNHMIAKLFKEIGWADELGSGVRNTFKFCGFYNPETSPEFVEGDVFKTIIPLESLEKSSGEMTGKISLKILDIIMKNPTVTIPDMAKQLNVSPSTIERRIKTLQGKNKTRRIGSTKSGHWGIL